MKGYVEHIIYRNEQNGYTVFNLSGQEEELTCTGVFPTLDEGEYLQIEGEYTKHPTYGTQYHVKSYEVKAPEDAKSIERYLASGAIKGIGATMAGRIVKKFGNDAFRIIEEEPERLAEIKGISERKAREIARQMEGKKELQDAMVFLTGYNISNSLAVKIYEQYGTRLYQVIKENPYQLADDIAGVGFKTADEIAVRAGFKMDSDFRLKGGICYVLLQAVVEGHTYLPYEELIKRTCDILGAQAEQLDPLLGNLCIERKVIVKEENGQQKIYSSQYYYMELNTAKMLHDVNAVYETDMTGVEKELEAIEKNTDITLDERQRTAVMESERNGILILTGGPGTGKTTTIRAMIKLFERQGLDICLAAPTGRAAKRMTEATGYEARTIHRMLELMGGPEGQEHASFMRNEENPLETDVIIIDEMSMVDLPLMNALLKAVLVGTRLILVGDTNQLPSVGPGSVLKDMIASHAFNTVMLTKIFRQAKESDIIVNAHRINMGEKVLLNNKSKDFFFLKREDANDIIGVMIMLIQKKLPGYVNARSYDIQVLTPTRKGLLGVERLNGILQQYLNPQSVKKAEKETSKCLFREGDKVMQIKNNYQIEWEIKNRYGLPLDKGMGIFNGDMGIIKEINLFSEIMTVEFDDNREVDYAFNSLDELELAYAITIHKSQGSEYPAVVMPMWPGPKMLMNRNLLYTAITRARKCVTMVGETSVFTEMAANENEQKRFSGLKERICEF